jgi:putative transcriptional regulator
MNRWTWDILFLDGVRSDGIYGIASIVLEILLDQVLAANNRTRYWLAKQTGISPSNLSHIARGKTSSIDFETIEKICHSLECQPGDLFMLRKGKRNSKEKRVKKSSSKKA